MLLRCEVCGAAIRGMTGLQELQNLRRHMKRKHEQIVNMNDALELRADFERAADATQ